MIKFTLNVKERGLLFGPYDSVDDLMVKLNIEEEESDL